MREGGGRRSRDFYRRKNFFKEMIFLSFQMSEDGLSRRRALRSEGTEIDNGDCSSGVEPRIVIPVVAGSNPVSHPILFFYSRCVIYHFHVL